MSSENDYNEDDVSSHGDSDASEEHLTSGSPTPDPENCTVESAIDTVSDQKLRRVLKTMCRESHEARRSAERLLLTKLHDGSNVKRKRYETCQNCEREYQVDVNRRKNECIYHPGMSRPCNGFVSPADMLTMMPLRRERVRPRLRYVVRSRLGVPWRARELP